jgi:hypothetical protein
MTIAIRAQNFRGLVKAELTVAPIALLAGENFAAKTSVLQAAAAALAAESGLLFRALELKEKDAALLVHDGAAKAIIEISGPDGAAYLEWPACRLSTKGQPPRASAVATGLVSLATTAPKERLTMLEPYLPIAPTKEDLIAELDEYFDPEALDQLWGLIDRDGWTATHKRQAENGTKAKGQWEAATGEHWGSVKSKNWRPEGYYPALDDYTEEELEQRARAAGDALEEAVRNQAVGEAEMQRLQQLAGALPDREAALELALKALRKAQENVDAARKARANLPDTGAASGIACPHCGGLLTIKRDLAATTLEKFTAAANAKDIRLAIADADGTLSRCQGAVATAGSAHNAAEQAVRESRTAAAAYEEAKSRQGSTQSIEVARGHEANARDALKFKRQLEHAETAAARWELLQRVIDVLAPTGLRQKKLAGGIDAFNKALGELCGAANWRQVAVTEDIAVTYAGRPYALLSESEQFRVRTVLQLAMAMRDQSGMVVIDRADLLVGSGREELFNLLARCEMPALVAMSLARPGLAPELSKWNLGGTWWISDGVAVPLAEAMADEPSRPAKSNIPVPILAPDGTVIRVPEG